MNFVLKEIYKDILLFHFGLKYEMTMSLIRIQEFYENPDPTIRNSYFTLENVMDSYALSRFCGKGKFDYLDKFEGFNFSGKNLLAFLTRFHQNDSTLREKEEELITALIPFKDQLASKYIIAVQSFEPNYLTHELSHAIFYLEPSYRNEAKEIIEKDIPEDISQMETYLKDSCYWEGVFEDEIIAYCSENNRLNKCLKAYLRKRKK